MPELHATALMNFVASAIRRREHKRFIYEGGSPGGAPPSTFSSSLTQLFPYVMSSIVSAIASPPSHSGILRRRPPLLSIFVATILLPLISSCSGNNDIPYDELARLEATMEMAHTYEAKTFKTLDSLKHIASNRHKTLSSRWNANLTLARNYRAMNADSALKYAWEASRIATESNNEIWDIRSRTHMVGAMSTAGLFFAARDELKLLLDKMPADSALKVEIWLTARLHYSYSRTYTEGQPEYENQFDKLYIACDDSLIRYLPQGDNTRNFLECERLVARGKWKEARNRLESLLSRLHEADNLYGMTAYQLARTYRLEGNNLEYASMLAKASISDIKANTKEGIALPELAYFLHKYGNKRQTDRAFNYINFALSDAIGGKARMRTYSLGASIPLIDAAYHEKVRASSTIMTVAIVGISILFVIMAILMFFLFRQIKRRRENQLKLARTARRQEAYIGSFIGLCSNYAERLDSLSKLVARKLSAGQATDLLRMVESGKFTEENEEFYKIFDHAILDLNPDFIDEVNSLLREDEHIEIKESGRLNAELRIYALVRLGVEESTRIAKILRYSVSTVYAYRNRMRNRALRRDTFESELAAMGKPQEEFQEEKQAPKQP